MQVEVLFNYAELGLETRMLVQQRTSEIKSLWNDRILTDVEIGRRLTEVKERIGYGRYRLWLEAEFPWSKTLANEIENVSKRFADVQNLDNLGRSAMRLLSGPSVPEELVQEAIDRAQSGETITHSTAKAMVESAKPKVESAKPKKESAFIPDSQVVVSSGAYTGQTVTVIEQDGEIVYAQAEDKKVPFLAGELNPPKATAEAQSKPVPKVDRVDSLEVMLDVERQRIKALESWIKNAIATHQLPDNLVKSGRDLLGSGPFNS